MNILLCVAEKIYFIVIFYKPNAKLEWRWDNKFTAKIALPKLYHYFVITKIFGFHCCSKNFEDKFNIQPNKGIQIFIIKSQNIGRLSGSHCHSLRSITKSLVTKTDMYVYTKCPTARIPKGGLYRRRRRASEGSRPSWEWKVIRRRWWWRFKFPVSRKRIGQSPLSLLLLTLKQKGIVVELISCFHLLLSVLVFIRNDGPWIYIIVMRTERKRKLRSPSDKLMVITAAYDFLLS